MTKFIRVAALAIALSSATGSAMAAQVSFGIRIGPPPAPRVVRVQPRRPGVNYVWVQGYWYPDGGRYQWRDGYWARPPYANARWIGPRYDGRMFYEGRWDGDRGRDGRFDRDRDRNWRNDRGDDRRNDRRDDRRDDRYDRDQRR